VRFEAVARGPVEAARARSPGPAVAAPEPEAAPRLELTKVLGLALLVDGGRSGHMHEGVPRGGAMLEGALARANLAAGNAPGACAIELYGSLELVVRGGPVTLADDGGGARTLADGDTLALASGGRTRARYLAARGGIAVPVVLGGRGTMLSAGLGGFEGRALQKGDRLPIGDAPERDDRAPERDDRAPERDDRALRILRGPDSSEAAFQALLATRFAISNASDRTGTRLEAGTPLPSSLLAHTPDGATTHRSQPMVVGAIEQTPTGLIVLGRDHPTTGGYPIVAVLATGSLDRFFGLPPGSHVVFCEARV
jgi:allophanate hydrolase subunit 2